MLMCQNQAYSCLWTRTKHTRAYVTEPRILMHMSQNQAYSCLCDRSKHNSYLCDKTKHNSCLWARTGKFLLLSLVHPYVCCHLTRRQSARSPHELAHPSTSLHTHLSISLLPAHLSSKSFVYPHVCCQPARLSICLPLACRSPVHMAIRPSVRLPSVRSPFYTPNHQPTILSIWLANTCNDIWTGFNYMEILSYPGRPCPSGFGTRGLSDGILCR